MKTFYEMMSDEKEDPVLLIFRVKLVNIARGDRRF
jgi:hypothetical protein